jgi:uncharacterized protein (DUF2141 family)
MAIAGSLLLAPAGGAAADLVVEVHNVKPRQGEVRVAVFDNARDFEAGTEIRAMLTDGGVSSGVFTRLGVYPSELVVSADVPAQGRTVVVRFGDLASGDYAVGAYQDLNRDQKLEITLGRVALEPWGVSNDAGAADVDPRWEEAKFHLPAQGATVVVTLRDERGR